MTTINPDSYCGIYCGACSVAMHGATGRSDGFVACLGTVPKDELACRGCKSDSLYAGCRVCSFRDCAGTKGIEHCADCAEYPCKMYKKWQSVGRVLPHVHEASTNLETVRRNGAATWLETQKKRWSCPDCGEPFSWYLSACPACGRKTKAYDLSGWQKLLCRFILPMAYRKGKAKGQGSG